MSDKPKFDLNANPTMAERRSLIAADYAIAAMPSDDGRFLRGVVTLPQIVAGEQALVIVCKHDHDTLELALTCANELANELKS